MDNYKIIIGAGIGGVVVMGIIFGLDIARLAVATQDYDIFVDPLKDQQSLFTMARVTIQNTGTQPLTNVKVNFGDGDILELGTLDVGKKILVSPPPENKMEFVQVSADNGIFVSKAYREPPKMFGMMGS